MRSIFSAALLAAIAFVPAAASAAPAAAPAATATPAAKTQTAKTQAAYTVQDTDLGTLLDDPVSQAILAKNIPEIVNSPQIDMGRAMTLSQLQQYAGDQLTNEKLAKIQADLDAAKPK
ncbi:hypothetical protein WBP07_21660 (plasmid) [Novosphingobium sp. BL-8A]|uniref:hypothetical protein n=1 Tax=Novosphingobium sp. BL-8A TaxID=3127639 RepID=UPI0037577C80